MVIAFCGHSSYVPRASDEQAVLDILEKHVKNEPCEFFLGEYGSFDKFAYRCAASYKKTHPSCKLIYITPYNSVEHFKKYTENEFDLIIYPELEKTPLRFAISHRNRWIAEQADIVIAYITHEYGGAYATFVHAKRRNKIIFNIAQQR